MDNAAQNMIYILNKFKISDKVILIYFFQEIIIKLTLEAVESTTFLLQQGNELLDQQVSYDNLQWYDENTSHRHVLFVLLGL